ncbi:hypothetical protein JAAARDRAFT_527232 [Jaapia argillacea MUCL 33604]|uniref:Uncharacterized protein n=1 Tax=Jaapia argillacea MUCL 33604 TaxID=933084 RepID=A0A067QEN7_9AGAM|nr:hypothetical protein JAAARDRAFT_527232 [Jaapia argillacea MUCL 33604]
MAAWRKLGEEDWKAAMDDFWIHRLARVEVYGTERSVSVASMNISHVELTEAQQEARTRFRERARDVLDSMKSPSADLLSHMSLVPNSLSRTAPTPDLLSRMEPPPDLLSRMSMPAALPSLPQKRSRLRYNDLEDVPRGDPDDDAMSWKQASYADESELPAPKRRKIDSPLPPARSRGSVKSFRGQRGRRTSYATSLSRMSVDVAPASNATGLDRVAERPATLSALTHSNYGGLVEMRSPGPSRVSNADHTSPRRLTEHSVSPSVRYDDSLLASGPLQSISTHATTPSPPHNDITIPSVDAPEGPMGQPSSDSPTQSPKMLRIRGAASSTP